MNQALLDKIESEQYRKEPAKFNVGDSVKVHTKVVEGDKERIQIFAGVVIGRRGRGRQGCSICRFGICGTGRMTGTRRSMTGHSVAGRAWC